MTKFHWQNAPEFHARLRQSQTVRLALALSSGRIVRPIWKKSLKGESWPFDLILNRLFGELIGHLDEYNRYLFGFYELSDIYVHYYYIRDDYP